MFVDFYDLSLFISDSDFLPSSSVLKNSQDSEEIIRMVSVIKEKRVESKLITILNNLNLGIN